MVPGIIPYKFYAFCEIMMKLNIPFLTNWGISPTSTVLINNIWVCVSNHPKMIFSLWVIQRISYFSPAVLALLAAGLSGSVGQTAAGRRRLPLFVPVFVSKPGEGHASRDGCHWISGRDVPTRLLQQLCWPPNNGNNIINQKTHNWTIF